MRFYLLLALLTAVMCTLSEKDKNLYFRKEVSEISRIQKIIVQLEDYVSELSKPSVQLDGGNMDAEILSTVDEEKALTQEESQNFEIVMQSIIEWKKELKRLQNELTAKIGEFESL